MPAKPDAQTLTARLRAMFKALEGRPVPERLRGALDQAAGRETPQRKPARND